MPHLYLTNQEYEQLTELLMVHAEAYFAKNVSRPFLRDFNPEPLMEKMDLLEGNELCLACGKELTSSDPRTKTCSDKCRQIHSRKQRTAKAKATAEMDAARAKGVARVKAAYAAGPEAVAALHAELGVS